MNDKKSDCGCGSGSSASKILTDDQKTQIRRRLAELHGQGRNAYMAGMVFSDPLNPALVMPRESPADTNPSSLPEAPIRGPDGENINPF
jgi:hypothetical protein